MEKQTFILATDRVRLNALNAVRAADDLAVVTIRPKTRTTEQNAKLWAMLADVANAKPEDRNWTPETWKCAFMHYLGHQVRFCEGLDGSGPFPIGFHSSRLTVREMADLITCIQAYGDEHGVEWSEVEKTGWAA